ncbi:MAG: hypothetical protein J6I52_02635 [Prevotella sp.]|nr:hypothetical protein [Prevotella sp.]
MKIHLVFIAVASIWSFSCSSNRQSEKIIDEWIGKEIILDGAIYTIEGYDTVDYSLDTFEYKILNYVDSEGCTGCKMKLEEWKDYIAHVDSLYQGKVGFVFCFATNSLRTIRFLLSERNFRHPVYIDTSNIFCKKNDIPNNYLLQTFLLNRNNKIIAIGNPIVNSKIEKLYNKVFQNIP